jgi:hypothetical protein
MKSPEPSRANIRKKVSSILLVFFLFKMNYESLPPKQSIMQYQQVLAVHSSRKTTYTAEQVDYVLY